MIPQTIWHKVEERILMNNFQYFLIITFIIEISYGCYKHEWDKKGL